MKYFISVFLLTAFLCTALLADHPTRGRESGRGVGNGEIFGPKTCEAVIKN